MSARSPARGYGPRSRRISWRCGGGGSRGGAQRPREPPAGGGDDAGPPAAARGESRAPRPGGGERREPLAARREEDALAEPGDRGRGGVEVVDPVPVVAVALAPAGALEAQQRDAGGRGRLGCGG